MRGRLLHARRTGQLHVHAGRVGTTRDALSRPIWLDRYYAADGAVFRLAEATDRRFAVVALGGERSRGGLQDSDRVRGGSYALRPRRTGIPLGTSRAGRSGGTSRTGRAGGSDRTRQAGRASNASRTLFSGVA